MSWKKAKKEYGKALDYFKHSKFEEALKHFDKALGFYPSQAKIPLNIRKPDIDKALSLYPPYPSVLSDKGAVLAKLEKFDEAFQVFNEALKINPNLTNAINNKKFVLKKLKQVKKVEEGKYIEQHKIVGPLNLLSVEELKFFKNLGVNPEDDKAIYLMGVELVQKNDYPKALKLYDLAIKLNSSDPNAWFGKAGVLSALKRFEESIKCYNEVLDIAPDHYKAWFGKGATLNNLNKPEKALECYNNAIKLAPNFFYAYSNKGLTLIKLSRFNEALQCIEKGIEMNPESAISWSDKANALNNLKRYEEAKEASLQAIKLDPKIPGAWVDKAIAELYLERFKEASDSIETALKINPKDSRALAIKANFKVFKEVSNDIKKYEDLLKKNPNDVQSFINKGLAYLRIEKFEDALECFNSALDIDPKSAEAWSRKGTILSSKGLYDEALMCADKSLEIDPNNSEFLSRKALVLAEQEKIEEAIKYNDMALKINPTSKVAHELKNYLMNFQKISSKMPDVMENYNIGNDFALEGNFQKAIEFHRKSVEADPQFTDGWCNLGGDYAGINDFENALKFFNKAIKLDPQHYRSWSNKGLVLFKQKRLEEAFICYNEAFKLNSDDIQVKNNRGYILQELAKAQINPVEESLKELEGKYPKSLIIEMVDEIEKKQRSLEVLSQVFGKKIDSGDPRSSRLTKSEETGKTSENELLQEKISKAELLIYEGNYEQIIQLCDEVIEKENTNPYAWFWKGKAFTALAKDNEAFECYRNAKNMGNKLVLMNNTLISEKILRSDKDRNEVRQRKFPDNSGPLFADADAWSKHGAYSQTMGNFEAALDCYERALKVDSNYEPAIRNRNRVIRLLEAEGLR